MAHELQVVSWNIRDGIDNPEIQTALLANEPDIAVMPEAYPEGERPLADTVRRFEKAGYALTGHNNDDDDGRTDRHALAVAFKPEVVTAVRPVYAAGRTVLKLALSDGSDFVGVHLDDRSEQRRVKQAAEILRGLGACAIVAGDFNAMQRSGAAARVLRLAKPFTHLLPTRDPARGEKTPPIQRLGSLSQRLTAMAAGTTMEAFAEAGFQDADPTRLPTMRRGPLAVQLDHILYRGNVAVTSRTAVDSADGLSDHERIRATLRVGVDD